MFDVAIRGPQSRFWLQQLAGRFHCFLTAEFLCAPPRGAMAAISVVRRRTGGKARELSDGRDRFDIFLGQNIENDPRTRSLPYLLRQDRERLMQQRIVNTNNEGAEET